MCMKVGVVKRSGTRHLAEIARLVEDMGFESLMLTEHTHVPLGSMSEAEAQRRAGLLDPFVALGAAAATAPAPAARVGSSTEALEALTGKASDAPLCYTCGTKMRPAGSCYVCEGCGSTSGCS